MHPKVQWLFSRCTWFHVLSSNSVPLRLVVLNDTAPVSCDERNDQGAIAMMDVEESCILYVLCSVLLGNPETSANLLLTLSSFCTRKDTFPGAPA